ncbi:MAG: AAA family ATPase, partial [Boseongicola sp. SB0677_bin_26]|nr:AAA family ATPase [Boseongicola sp. SB0677_bin_26]
MAACTGDVVFDAEAIRRLIEDHTNEAGVAELHTKLAAVCRRVVERRPPGCRGTETVTPAVVREVLGAGEVLPSAVRAAIAHERRRLADGSSDADAATKTNDWIACLEKLPWTRRSEASVDLSRARAALDAGHAGLAEAKSCILEYLAGRRRNPRSGAVLCLVGPPGVGKTSLAKCTAEAVGRGFVRLACGGLRDESDLRGHNRTWKDAQAGWILRELRRVGSKDPVIVLDEIDKLGTAPAAVLLEVLDPAQNNRFRDAFVELPFDLSEVLFLTTANEVLRIPPALRDRLEVIELPGYSENEKVAIGETHLVTAQNRAAGLTATPVRFTRGALRRIIREVHERAGGTRFRAPPAGDLPEGGAGSGDRRRIAGAHAGHGPSGPRVPRRAAHRAHGQRRPFGGRARRAVAAGGGAGAGPSGPRAAVGVVAHRSRARPYAGVPAVPGGDAVDGARQTDTRPGALAVGPRRGARGARGGEGAAARLHRRAPGEPGHPVRRAVPAGRARGGQVVAGASGRRRSRPYLRVGGLRRAGLGGVGAWGSGGPAGPDRRGAAAR